MLVFAEKFRPIRNSLRAQILIVFVFKKFAKKLCNLLERETF